MESAVGYLRRNLLAPVPGVGSLAEPSAPLAEGCARLNAAAGCRDGRAPAEAPRGDLAEMRAPPGAAFDAVRWVRAGADKCGHVEVDGRECVAGPARHGRGPLVGTRPDSVEIVADRGRGAAVPPRAYGAGPAARNPLSLVPAIVARPRAFGESAMRRDMPEGLVEGIDRMDAAGRRQTLGSMARASAASGFDAACGAAPRVVEGGRVPDDATVNVLAGRIAPGALGGEGGADLSAYDGFPRGGEADARWRGARAQGRGGRQEALAHHLRARGVGERRQPEAGRVPRPLPRGRGREPRRLQARLPASAPRAAGAQDLRRVRLVGGVVARGARPRGPALALVPGPPRGPRADGRRRHGQDPHGKRAVPAGARQAHGGPPLHGLLARRAPQAGARRGPPGQGGPQIGRARLLVVDELGFLPLDPDGARLLLQVFADAYERQSVAIATSLEFSRWGSVFGDDQTAAAVINRVVRHGRLVQLRGESYRVRHALMQEG